MYNRIAVKFSHTRKHPWDDFTLFDRYINKGDRVLDIGCGNGRLAGYLGGRHVWYAGVDASEQLIAIARTEHPDGEFAIADATTLPFSGAQFNAVFCIATLHHIPSTELRQRVIAEAYRVLKPGGRLIMTEWNLWGRQWWKLLAAHSVKKIAGSSGLDWGDVMKPWKNERGETVGQRYLHPFTRGELTRLLRRSGFDSVRSWYTKRGAAVSWYTGYNIVTIAKKP